PARRGPGRRRGGDLQPRPAGQAAGPGQARHRRGRPRPSRGPRRELASGLIPAFLVQTLPSQFSRQAKGGAGVPAGHPSLPARGDAPPPLAFVHLGREGAMRPCKRALAAPPLAPLPPAPPSPPPPPPPLR